MKIVIADGDDWQGLYIDGELKMEGHSFNVADVIKTITGTKPEYVEVDADWLMELGRLPQKLSEVQVWE